jgi:hypothetical protein
MATGSGRWVTRGAMLAAVAAVALGAQGCGCDASSNDGTTAGQLASKLTSPRLIAAGRTQVLVSDQSSVRAVAKADGTVTLISTPAAAALAAFGDVAAWASGDEILTRSLPDTAPTVVARGLSWPRAVVVDAANVYWADGHTGTVAGVPLVGGATFTLVTGASLDGGLAVDTGRVYWGAGGAVFSATPGGGAPLTVATGEGPVVAIAAVANHVAWIENDPSGPTLRVPAGTGSTLAIGPTPSFGAIAATSRGVYVFDTDRSLQRVAWDGSLVATLGRSDYAVGGLAVGDSTVYYTAPSVGQLFQVVQ